MFYCHDAGRSTQRLLSSWSDVHVLSFPMCNTFQRTRTFLGLLQAPSPADDWDAVMSRTGLQRRLRFSWTNTTVYALAPATALSGTTPFAMFSTKQAELLGCTHKKKKMQIGDVKIEILARSESVRYFGQLITFQHQETTEIKNRIRTAWATFHKYKQEADIEKLLAQTPSPTVRRSNNSDDMLRIGNMGTQQRA